jgi:hypothetical protein
MARSRFTPEAFGRPLSILEAARLLRMPPNLVEQGILTGELPSVQHSGEIHVDGPALARSFCTRANWPDTGSAEDKPVA